MPLDHGFSLNKIQLKNVAYEKIEGALPRFGSMTKLEYNRLRMIVCVIGAIT
jgi:hypothetical protein